ncbi:hypothetical protein GOODEAATRI_006691 [Goodea atripinnis]|uniref:MHC class I antigen n=1 Tax=Goodea atripinnis TaxID=208336 RepID=A0ABV0PVV9_9TELE
MSCWDQTCWKTGRATVEDGGPHHWHGTSQNWFLQLDHWLTGELAHDRKRIKALECCGVDRQVSDGEWLLRGPDSLDQGSSQRSGEEIHRES